MRLSSDEAYGLSKAFRELAVALGDYRYARWDELTPAQRKALEDEEWSLLNHSSDLVTKAVGLTLDEADASLAKLQNSTGKARSAVKTLKTVKQVIEMATAAVGLAAAIVSKDIGAIGKNAKALFDAATPS
jgi:hypothetical protein